MKVILTSIFILFGISVFSQNLQLTGKAADEKNTPVSYADVTLSVGDSIIKSELTKEDGTFELSAPQGSYTLTLKQLGEVLYSQNIDLTQDTDLGTLKIQQAKELQMVTITGQKKLIERKVDRLIFNVENSVAATGGDALDALKVTPGLRVQNDQISMIGKSGMSVMIDDRLVQLSGDDLINYLKTISSDNIKSIEVITTPPAKYEAEGNSGIVNIKLKKNPNFGLSGSFSTSFTQTKWFSQRNNVTLNYQVKKWKSSLRLSQYDNVTSPYENMKIEGNQAMASHSDRKDFDKGYGINLSMEYKLSENSDIGFIYDFLPSKGGMDIESTSVYKEKEQITKDLLTSTKNREKEPSHTLNLYYDLKLDTLGKKMSIIGNYYGYTPDTHVDFTTFDKVDNSTEIIKNLSFVDYKILSGQIDFELPFNWVSMETGAKFSDLKNDSDVQYLNFLQNNYILDPTKSNKFNYDEKNFALYYSISKNFSEKWEAKVGLRYEYSWVEGYSPDTNETNKNDYGNFFPSGYLVYKLNKNNSFSISYSKRIDRPRFRALNPFRWYDNTSCYSTGNPQLEPSYNHNFEIGYVWKGKLSISAYLQKMLNGYDQLSKFENDILVYTYKNFYDNDSYGININYNDNITKWWEANFSISGSYSKAKIFATDAEAQNGYGLDFATQNTFTFNKSKTFFGVLNYSQSLPSRLGSTYYYPQGYSTVGLRLLLMGKNLQVSFTVNDLFKQVKSHAKTYYKDYTDLSDNYYDTQNIRLSVSYRFGNNKVKNVNKEIEFEEKNRVN